MTFKHTEPIYVAPIVGQYFLAEHIAPFDLAFMDLSDAYRAAWRDAIDASTDPQVIAWRTRHAPGTFDGLEDSAYEDDDPRWPIYEAWIDQQAEIAPILRAIPKIAVLGAKVEAAQQARAQAVTEYETKFFAAMTESARALGHTGELIPTGGPDATKIDLALVADLEDAARTVTPKPALTPPAL